MGHTLLNGKMGTRLNPFAVWFNPEGANITRLFDLHTHTLASDGILSAEALLSRASLKGVDVLALTDHDTLEAIPAARRAAASLGVTLIAGIEVSSQWRGRGIHVVGLAVDTEAPSLRHAVAQMAETRELRAIAIARALAKAGLSDEQGILAKAREEAGAGSIGRPHFARALVAMGKVTSMNMAFKRYLGSGKPGDVKQHFPELAEAVALIVAAGGVAVLAHPLKYDLTRTKLCELMADFRAAGGEAVELISGYQDAKATQDLARLINQFELFASQGSDFHMPDQPWQELGCTGQLPDAVKPVWELPAIAALLS
ncbi:PHP domain-containing protein [Simiduia litorea]|uniref:PHP domain-containing protein n=1 Tax=Simiduia litorea TaxID=1435348 RepID=UPI0036F30AD5